MTFALYWLLLFTATRCISSSELLRGEGNVDQDDHNCHNQSITLNFQNLALSNIGPNFIASPIISCLSLNGNGINTISPNAFDELPNLTYLDLSNNEWQGQQMLSSGGHKTLRTLILDNAFSRNIYNPYRYETHNMMSINASYPELEKLFLRNNGLIEIVGCLEADFPKLLYLDLSNNLIDTFKTDSRYNDFSWLPKSLKCLKLDNNRLTSLALTNLEELESLSIGDNKLESILLQNLNKLKQLSTSGNKLHTISLQNLNSLKKFIAEDNGLTGISYGQFQGTPELEDLNLANNQITDFDGRIVDFMPKLQNLTLTNNLLSDVPLIRDAPNLESYSLRCNQISKLGSHSFNNMRNLKLLDLAYNEIQEIKPETFAGLEKLETLSLGRNKIANLPSQWMLRMQNLRFLNLEDNRFTNLEALELNDSPSLMQLYLQNNDLKYLRAHSLDSVPENVTIQLDKSLSVMSDCKKGANDEDMTRFV